MKFESNNLHAPERTTESETTSYTDSRIARLLMRIVNKLFHESTFEDIFFYVCGNTYQIQPP